MSYKTYITEALVCGSTPSNTSDKSFLLFTREAGMLYASAKSVREERSKHRYALQDCALIRVTLVRGRSGWKITGTEAMQNFYSEQETREGRKLVRDVVRLLRRLIHGEESVPSIFDETKACLTAPVHGREGVTYLLYTLRTLHTLGYVEKTAPMAPYLSSTA